MFVSCSAPPARWALAHHLDAPWRPSDLEQRNGRIIRQGNLFYERDPEHFSVGIYNYATKQTYDARMWQTIEYKAAAIEQFRKGDLLQRVIDDVQSEAANAAEMKAAASGNPLILMQVQLAADLRKLEALYSQHQRGQHRLRDRLKWLNGTDERLAKAESAYAANIRHRDSHTHIIKEKDKEKIRIELFAGDKMLTDRDGEKIKDILLGCVKEITRNAGARVLFGSYRGFAMHLERYAQSSGGKEGFRIVVTGTDGQEFKPDNLVYLFDDKLSLSGLFQRMDNFLAKGFDEAMEKFRETCRHEKAELETTREALGREFPQKEELTWRGKIIAPSSGSCSVCRMTRAMFPTGHQRLPTPGPTRLRQKRPGRKLPTPPSPWQTRRRKTTVSVRLPLVSRGTRRSTPSRTVRSGIF